MMLCLHSPWSVLHFVDQGQHAPDLELIRSSSPHMGSYALARCIAQARALHGPMHSTGLGIQALALVDQAFLAGAERHTVKLVLKRLKAGSGRSHRTPKQSISALGKSQKVRPLLERQSACLLSSPLVAPAGCESACVCVAGRSYRISDAADISSCFICWSAASSACPRTAACRCQGSWLICHVHAVNKAQGRLQGRWARP